MVFNAGASLLTYGDNEQYSVAPNTVDVWINGQLIDDDAVRNDDSGDLTVFGFKTFNGVVGMEFQIDDFEVNTTITAGPIPERPNILFIAIDDLNDWVGFLGGHPQTKTPNMDALAAMGANFTNAHCPAPGCSPSRSAIMFGAEPTTTGLYPFYNLVDLDAQDMATLDAFLPMPKFFRDEGYATFGYSKIWHNPDNAYKQSQQWDVYQSPGSSGLQLVNDPKYYESEDNNNRTRARPANNPPTDFGDRKIADAAVDILQQTHIKPFFLAVGFILPHSPFVTPVDNYDRFDFPIEPPPILAGDLSDVPLVGRANAQLYVDIPLKQDEAWEKVRRGYLASISFTDDNVGLVLDALEASDYADNTIIVLWSDHGYHLGEKQSFSKFSLWEESTRTPFIIYDPRGQAANGEAITQPVSLINIYKTLADMVGLTPPSYVDGISLVPWLDDPSLPKDTPALTTWGRGNYTLRSDDWRYTRYYDGSEELYHNAIDPNEWTNLAGDPTYDAIKAQLAAYLPTTEAPQIQSGMNLYNVSDADSPDRTTGGYQNQADRYESLGLHPPIDGYSFSEWIELTGYVGNDASPEADPNNNGIPNILEYAIKIPEGGDARDYLPELVFEQGAETNHLAITFRRRLDAPDLVYEVDGSNDLSGAWNPVWDSGSTTHINVVSTTYNADGTQTITVRYPDDIDDAPKAFLRSRVSAP
jgi:arylsulfatase A-like enzyme